MGSRLWKFLTTDIRELASQEAVEDTADAAEAVLGLAEVLQEEGPKLAQLAPLVSQLDSLLDVLNSPLGAIAGAALPFLPIATGLLKFYRDTTKKEPTVAQSVALVSQAAYLETVKTFLAEPKVKVWLAKVGDRPGSSLIKQRLKNLDEWTLDDKEARRALLYFHESKLAVAYGEVLTSRLVELGLKGTQATKIADKLARQTNRMMLPTLVQYSDSVKALVEWFRIGGKEDFQKCLSIDIYLEEVIAPKPYEKVFAESFAFKDIYVPLKAQALTRAGQHDKAQEPSLLNRWVQLLLKDDQKKDQVMFVQGGPGRGKSVFCRILADWVRRYEYPRWTPILIRLRDVSVLSRDFEETLVKAVDRDFAKTDSGWLTDRNINYFFILDGFDELLMEGRTSSGLDNFLDQIGRFQEQCAQNSEKGHRVLITGRTLALQSIESRLPSNLMRVEILPMDDEIQLRWFDRWSDLIGQDKSHLMRILQDKRLPEKVRELAREPLLLYLLAAMHRDGELNLEMFEGAEGAQAKVLIYERTLDWVLTKQRAEGHRWNSETKETLTDKDLNPEITELVPEQLRRVLQEAGLCVVQSEMEFARIKAIENRLRQDDTTKNFLEEAQRRLATDDIPIRNALAAFYLQEGQQGEGSIEFVHKSFGEFLCAERIVNGLVSACQPGRNREYDIDNTAFFWLIYDLLGCPVLTPEIVEYLTALLTKHRDFKAVRLHKRLYDFYWQWSNGEFIDASPENLPQRKMRMLREYRSDNEKILGQRQVDMYVGLNIMILLFELHRYGLLHQDSETTLKTSKDSYYATSILAFHPCKQAASSEINDPQKLSHFIGMSHCLSLTAFHDYVGYSLIAADFSGVDLSGANLSVTDLSGANLSGADLRIADLSVANLGSANLSSANLSGANLSGANLSGANLSVADLSGANLSGANLSVADLSIADLSVANLIGADLSGADFSGANLSGADLSVGDLNRANLSGASLGGVNLNVADLSGANLSGADLSGADLSGADLSDANLIGADLSGAVFSDGNEAVRWNQSTNWLGVKGLESVLGMPEVLTQQLEFTKMGSQAL